MKKIIIILGVMLFSLCTLAQERERQPGYQIPAKLEEFLQYADSLGYGATVHYNQSETRKVDFFYTHSLKRDENAILFLDSIRNTFYALADEAQETYFWESHTNGTDSIEYALQLNRGHLRFAYKPYPAANLSDRGFVYLNYMCPIDSIKSSRTTPTTNTSKPSEGKKKITFTPVFNHVK